MDRIRMIANQLLLHTLGAKKPKQYSIIPIMTNRIVNDILNESFNFAHAIIQRIIPLNRITKLFKHTFTS